MSVTTRSQVLRYGAAAVTIALATAFRLLLDPVLGDRFPFAFLFFAVLVSAWYGGFGPAVTATLLGAVASALFLLPVRDRSAVQGVENEAGLGLYLGVGLGIAALGGAMRAARQRAEATAVAATLQREELRTTLASIGDAVLVTDAEGRVVSLNPVAEAMTGWTTGEAAGKPLEAVFAIVNERTRQTVESPVARVLRRGTVVGLANHTVLIAKDGTERPIDDSAAPVRDATGGLIGVVLVFRDVADRRRAEEARRRLAAIVESSDDAIVGKDLDGTITSWNAGAERLYGYTPAEVVGKPFSVLVPPDRTDEVRETARRLQQGERLDHFETVRRRKDGTRIDVSVSYSPVKDDGGHLVGTAVITRDITIQKRAEEQLRRSEQDLADFFENATVGLHWVGPDGTILRANRAELDLLGYEREEYVGRNIAEFHADDQVIDDILRCLRMGERLNDYPARMRCKDGSIRDVLIDSSVLWEGERFVHTRCFTRDVTDQRRAEEDARAWERHLQLVTDSAPVFLAQCDAERRFKFVNKPYATRFGLHPRDIIGRTIPEVLGDEAFAALAPHVEAALSGRRVEFEVEVPYRGIGTRFMKCAYEPEFDGAGRVVGYVGAILDVTEGKRVERALWEVEARFAAVVNHTPACVFAKDRQGRYLLANRSLAQLLGREPDEFPGRTDYDFFPPEVAEQFGSDDAAIIESGQPRTYEESFLHDGVTRTYLTVKFPLRDEKGDAYAACAVATEITDLKRAQEDLRSTADRLHLALGAARLGDWSWEAASDVVTLSDRAAAIFGIPPGPHMTWAEMQMLLHEEDRGRARLQVEKAVAEGTHYDIEYRVNRADGTQVWVAALGRGQYSSAGDPVGMIGVVQDITERKKADEALRESEERFASFMQHLPGLAWIKDEQGRYVYANEAAERAFRTERENLYGKTDEEVFPPEVAAQFKENDRRALSGGTGVQAVETLEQDDGVLHYSIVGKFPIPRPDGTAALVGGVAIDITDRMRVEEALRQREEQLRLLTDALPVLISYVDADQRYRIVNRQYEVWFGRPRDEMRDKTLREVLGEAAHAAVREQVEAALAGQEVTYERLIPYRDAGNRFVRANYVPLFDSGKVRGFFSLVSDITESKRAEQDARFLADASATFAALVDYESTLQKVARLAVPTFADWCTVDMLDDGDTLRRLAVAHVDPAKVELAHELHHRFPADRNAPQGVWNVIRTGQAELIPEISDELLTTSVSDPELLQIMRDLGLRSYMGVPLSVRGKVLGVVTFISAESDRRYDAGDLAVAEDLALRAAVAIENARLYQEVREADRKKDEFLGALAHELRNPLAPVRNALQVLKLARTDGEVFERAREMAERQVEALTRMVDDLLDVSRIMRGKIELKRERVDLAAVVGRAVETARPVIDAGRHDLSVSLPEQPVWIDADVVRLAQVISNLLNNAAKYTEAGGRIWLIGDREGGEAVVRVRDTGIGIAPETLSSIFDMFMQVDSTGTRSQGGLGIGLTVVRNLVEMHGGAVEAHSAGVGRGSEFVVRLPLAELVPAGQGGPAAQGTGREVPNAARRILVVDDNVDAGESLAMLLRLQGHEVRVAHDGLSGLKLAEANPPDVAFLDIGMPRMTGYDLAKRFRESSALRGVLLVAMTGWGQEGDRRRSKEAGFDHHLVKPAEPDAVHRLVMTVPSGG